MLTFIIRRVLWMMLVMFVITLLVFVIFFKTPGVDPARQIAGRNPSPQVMLEIRHQFGLDRPFPVQYGLMMKKIFISRDLVSYSNQGQRVIPEIAAATPATLSLVFGAALIWVVAAIGMGVAAAVLKGTIFDPLLMVVALIGISIPVFWLGEVVNLITQSRYHDTILFSWVPPLGYDYIRTARAKGLTEQRVLRKHTLRNSMITFVSLFGLDFGILVGGGALLTEIVFGIHGVGYLTYQSLTNLDLPVIMATVIYGAFFIVLASALVDIAYARLDPRVRLS